MTDEELDTISRRNGAAGEDTDHNDDIGEREAFDDIDDIPDIPEFSAFSDEPEEDVVGYADEPREAGAEKSVDYSYDADDEDEIDCDLYEDLSIVHTTAKEERKREIDAVMQEYTAKPEEPTPTPVPAIAKPAQPEKAVSEIPALKPAPAARPTEEATAEERAGNPPEPEKTPQEPLHITNVEVTGANRVKVNKIYMLNTVISMVTLCVIAASIFTGYAYIKNLEDELGISKRRLNMLENKAAEEAGEPSVSDVEAIDAISLIEEEELSEPNAPAQEDIELGRGKILIYDSYVGYGWVPVLSGVKTNEYKQEDFSIDDNDRMKYVKDGEISSYFGIDVSSFQGDIDWNAVRSDGVEFAILRIGVRGYGEEGNIRFDDKFEQNYENAHKAGVDLGVYFYSQAISVDEAVEEAEFVLEKLEGRPLEYPVVFDWEPVDPNTAEGTPRTEDVMPGTLTLGARAFCETVKDAGYDAMIYTNKKMAYIKYDMRQLADYPVWLALYSTDLTYYYDFDMWQYGFGRVDGIEGDVDLDISIIR